jgi:hypothetical protein
MSYTMQSGKSSAGLAQGVNMVAAAARALQQRLKVVLGHPGSRQYERILADSVDRFEVERRERAWNRGDCRDGSLLGR